MSDPNYRRREVLPLFAVNDPPRSTKRQETRWSTQDRAFQNAPVGQAATVLEALRATPSTCDEVEQRLGMTHQSCSAAINKLMRDGLIHADGERLTRSGRSARVWHARRNDNA